MKEITKRQQEVLAFIAEYIEFHTYPPTIREIAQHFSISVKGAHDHVTALKKKNRIKTDDNRFRTIELVKDIEETSNDSFKKIPLLGTVAAGRPVLSEENLDGTIAIHTSMLKRNSEYFALTVRGDSMEGAGILDGDTAIIEKQPLVQNGEIAVVQMDDAVTLKTFYRENTRIRLQPENPRYPPIYISHDLRIMGRLSHIIRFY
ncbi:MAG: transcriptional repressor LexA [Treponema sp.]|jgi:repressor LexA|nr:transcriptional repressor LexA [Treponema sp.]